MKATHQKSINVLLVVLGAVIFLFGGIGALTGLVSIADPIGAQLANDADPLGIPQSRTEIAVFTVFYAGLAFAGGWLFNRGRRNVSRTP